MVGLCLESVVVMDGTRAVVGERWNHMQHSNNTRRPSTVYRRPGTRQDQTRPDQTRSDQIRGAFDHMCRGVSCCLW